MMPGRPPHLRAWRKRHSSPASGPARKRRAEEESMIGGLQNLSLNNIQSREKDWFERWQELESRLSDQLSDEEEPQSQSQEPRVLFSEQLEKIVKAPVPDIVPIKTGGPCTALVLWRPPVIGSPDLAEPPSPPADSSAAAAAPPQPPAAPFSADTAAVTASAPFHFGGGTTGFGLGVSAPYHFGGVAPEISACSASPVPLAGCFGAHPSMEDEAMEL